MNKILGYPLAFVRFVICIILLVIFIGGYILSLIFTKGSRERAFALRRNYLSIILPYILNVKMDIKGTPIEESALYVCNHRTFVDPAISTIYINAFVIAKAEIANYPLINKGAELTGVIWVKRENRDSRSATRQALVKTIESGFNVMVYPEGTTNDQKNTLTYLGGTFREMSKINKPVVPIALEYRDAKDLWKDRSLAAQYFRQFSTWSTEVKMEIGPAFRNSDGVALSRQCRDWTDNKIDEMQKDWSRAFT